jgi:Putative Actinobacterial Holin-X, holin superfamily III
MTMIDGRREAVRDRSTGELVKDLSRDTSLLMRQEIALAKAEMAEKAEKAGVGLGMLAGAAVAGLLMLGTLTAFLVLALDGAMPAWTAALVVTLCWALVAGALALLGRQALREMGSPMPEQTMESVKEDIEWLKERNRSEVR